MLGQGQCLLVLLMLLLLLVGRLEGCASEQHLGSVHVEGSAVVRWVQAGELAVSLAAP